MKNCLSNFLVSACAMVVLATMLLLALILPKFRRWFGEGVKGAVEGHC